MTDRFGISSQTIPELRTDCRYFGFVSGELPVTFAHRAGQGPGDENSALWERDWQCTFALCQGMNGHCSVQDTPNAGCCCSGHVRHLPLSIVHSWREQILSGETWGVRGVSLVLRWVLLQVRRDCLSRDTAGRQRELVAATPQKEKLSDVFLKRMI